jgi:hypothetical protein
VISELPTQVRELSTHELVRIVWGIESVGALRWAQRCEAPRVSSRQIHLLNERNDGDRDSVTAENRWDRACRASNEGGRPMTLVFP